MTRADAPDAASRRRFLTHAAGAGAAAWAGFGLLPACIRQALAVPAASSTGTLRDVEHVVILMQENRSFDHYFGTFPGVRGYGDRATVPLPDARSVWHQRDGSQLVLPFHLDTQTTRAMRVASTPHTWPDAQLAWDEGRLGEWPRHKTALSMGYYGRADIPFQWALAEAFTLCDAHHCSIQGGTLPNRAVFMTGTNVAPGRSAAATDQSDALIDNANNRGLALGPYRWTTYPERLQAAGVSWRIYQDPLDNWDGLLAPWESFAPYRECAPGQSLFDNAMTHWSLSHLAEDVIAGRLPAVSWVVPPPVWSEHPAASSPLQGASFAQRLLESLLGNPSVWSKTALIISYDENDGFFDHVPPPAVPSVNADGTLAGKATLELPLGTHYHASEVGGVNALRPYGLGPRVPLLIVSPWSCGGWVNSQVFDHTSTIRFLEARFGVHEPNISAWHRAVSGDLSSCFDFAHPNGSRPPALPDMSDARGEPLRLVSLPPVRVPSVQHLPAQRPGTRRSRALPYALHAHLREGAGPGRVDLRFENVGRCGAVFHVYDRLHLERAPRRYTLEAGRSLDDTWSVAEDDQRFDLSVLGPNGFRREFTGRSGRSPRVAPGFSVQYRPGERALELSAWNAGNAPTVLQVSPNAYRHDRLTLALPAGGRVVTQRWSTADSGDWYDLSVRCGALPRWSQRFAGRMETGRDGVSDPALGTRSAPRAGR